MNVKHVLLDIIKRKIRVAQLYVLKDLFIIILKKLIFLYFFYSCLDLLKLFAWLCNLYKCNVIIIVNLLFIVIAKIAHLNICLVLIIPNVP